MGDTNQSIFDVSVVVPLG